MGCARLALFVTLLIPPPILRAQTTIPANSRVRVSLRDGTKITGQLAEVRGDTLVMIKSRGMPQLRVAVPVNQTSRIAVSRGEQVSFGRVFAGAFAGGAASLLATAVIPGLSATKCSADVCSTSPAFKDAFFIGAFAGSVVGAMLHTERWETIPMPVRVAVGENFREGRVGVSFAF